MAVTIRRSIDALPPFFVANSNLDKDRYALELVTLFDRAIRKVASTGRSEYVLIAPSIYFHLLM